MLNKVRTDRVIAMVLSIIMCVSLLSGVTVFADNVQKAITIAISGESFYLPPEKLTVSSGIACKYGYETEDDGKVSVLDALVAAHEYLLGDELFNAVSSNEFLAVSESGFITKVLGEDSSASGFFVNDRQPNDEIYNELYGSYGAYTANKAYLNDGDFVNFFFYQDKSYWTDYYAFFDKKYADVHIGEELALNLSGFMSFYGCYAEEAIESRTEPISEIAILAGTDKNNLKSIDTVTDENGNFKLSFDKPGVYYVSAQSYSDEYTYFVLPWCEVTVSATAVPTEAPTATPTEVPTATYEPSINTDDRVNELIKNISESYRGTNDTWALFDMVCGGFKSDIKDADGLMQKLIDESYKSENIGETSKDALAVKALGGDLNKLKTSDGMEFDLIEKLLSFTANDITYVTDAIFAMSVYDSGDYTTVDGNLTREALLKYILTSRNSDGIWGYTWGGTSYPDYDSTAMVLNALAPYYNAESADKADIDEDIYTEVKNTVNSIVSILSSVQGDSGTYYSSNTDAVVIIGLVSIGINPAQDERFVKNGKNVVDDLLGYALLDNSGFGYTSNEEYNALATEQSFRALIAYLGLLQNNDKAYNIYNISPIKAVLPNATATPRPNTGTGSGGNSGGSTGNITVTISVVGDTAHGDKKHSGSYPTWISSVKKTATSGAKASEVIKAVLEEKGYTVNGIDSGYISSVTSPEGVTIGEFTNGKNSGWLYTVNGKSPSVSMNAYTLKNGDVIKLYYSDDYTKDTNASISGGGSGGLQPNTNPISPIITPNETTAPADNNAIYSDLTSSHWAYEYITKLSEKGLLSGYEDKTIRPDNSVSRAEFVTILCRAYNLDTKEAAAENSFSDVNPSEWYTPYIICAVQEGYIKGYDNGTFMPNEYITREDICVILDRVIESRSIVLSVQEDNISVFADASEVSDYAQSSVENMRKLGIINGKENDRFAPKENATRAEVSKMVAQILN